MRLKVGGLTSLSAQNTGRPRHYSEDRVDERCQELDRNILASVKFKLPESYRTSQHLLLAGESSPGGEFGRA